MPIPFQLYIGLGIYLFRLHSEVVLYNRTILFFKHYDIFFYVDIKK